MKSRKPLIIGGAIVLLILVFVFATYNSLVQKQEKVKQQWSEVQSTYQRRIDLIPNLVNVVKGNAEFESSTLEEISAARAGAQSGLSSATFTPESVQQQTAAQNNLAAATSRLLLRIEKYPVLKGTAAYAGLQTQLEGTERRIKIARNDFNATVAAYNNKVRSFPSSLVAGMLGFRTKEGFTATEGSANPVEIKF